MGASLAYLKEPNKHIDQETGQNESLSFATGSMQGWRLNMVRFTLDFHLSDCLQEDAHVAQLNFLESD
jgi:hypothetical protein